MSEAGTITIDSAAIKQWCRRYSGFVWAFVSLMVCLGLVGIAILISVAVLIKQAEQGDAYAQSRLCVRYSDKEKYRRAVRWCRLSAEQGNSAGQHGLGKLYERGNGVPEDHGEAFRLIKLAAEAHYRDAQISLSQLYRSGVGVEVDHVAAYMWADIALHHPAGRTRSTTFDILLQTALIDATEEQKAAGSRASHEWRKDHPGYLDLGSEFDETFAAHDDPESSDESDEPTDQDGRMAQDSPPEPAPGTADPPRF